jgi:acetoin utilization deacetylase AcuC-like enzyme
MAKRLADLGKPVLAVLEGGYNFKETALASLGVVKALLGEEKLPENVKNVNFENMYEKCQMNKIYHAHIDQIIDHHARYWKVLES